MIGTVLITQRKLYVKEFVTHVCITVKIFGRLRQLKLICFKLSAANSLKWTLARSLAHFLLEN
jgi:hypothetical protein